MAGGGQGPGARRVNRVPPSGHARRAAGRAERRGRAGRRGGSPGQAGRHGGRRGAGHGAETTGRLVRAGLRTASDPVKRGKTDRRCRDHAGSMAPMTPATPNPAPSTWHDFRTAEPDFADTVRKRFQQYKHHVLSTLRKDGSPRVTGLEVEFRMDALWFGMMPDSRKALDLRRDPRFAIQANPGPDAEMARAGTSGSPAAPWRSPTRRPRPLRRGGDTPEPFLLFRADPTEVVRTGLDGDDLVAYRCGVPATRCAPCAEAPTRARSARCDPPRPPASGAVRGVPCRPGRDPAWATRAAQRAETGSPRPRPPAPVRRPGEPAPRTALRRQSGGRRRLRWAAEGARPLGERHEKPPRTDSEPQVDDPGAPPRPADPPTRRGRNDLPSADRTCYGCRVAVLVPMNFMCA